MARITTALNPKIPIPSPAVRANFVTEEDLLTAYTAFDWVDWAVARLLDSDIEATLQDSENWTPLHLACFISSPDAIEHHSRRETYLNARDSMGWTPLFWAAFNGDVTTVRLLLHRSDHMIRDINGWTVLKWALAMQETEVAQILLKHHENCLQKLSTQPKAMLKELNFQQASQSSRNNDILQDMLATYPDDPLAGDKYKKLCKLLIDADMRLAGLDNLWPPGHFDPPVENIWATMSKEEMCNGMDYYLVEGWRRPKPESGKEWKSRLLQVAIRDDNLEAVRLLLELGADVNYRLGGTRSALFAAACRRNPSYVKILLEHGANPSTRDHKKQTPLQRAVANGFEATSAALISGGADVNENFDGEVKFDGDGCLLTWPSNKSDGIAANKTPLMLACGLITPESDPELRTRIVRLLLSSGADVVIKDRGGSSAIHYAARSRTYDIIKLVIDAGADGTDVDNFGRNTFHHFGTGYNRAKRGHAAYDSAVREMKKCLDLLLKHCSLHALSQIATWHCRERQDYSTDHGKDCIHTPMSLAIAREHGWDFPDWDLFRWLHESGAQLHTSHRLDTLLDLAIEDVQPAAVRLLIRHEAKLRPESQHWFPSRKPKVELDCHKLSSILADVLPLGLDINAADAEGRTILHRAAANIDSKRLPGILMRAGADPRKDDSKGLDSFLHACPGGNYKTLRSLLAGDPRKRDGHWTQELNVANLPRGAAALRTVCAAILDAQHLATRGTTDILCHAAKTGANDMVKTILTLGADPNTKGEDGLSPLHLAAEKGNTKMAIDIVTDIADGNIQDAHGRRAVHLAALNNHTDTVKYLLSAGCNVDAPDTDGWRAIHFAAWKGDADTVRALVEAGADIHVATRSWSTIPGSQWTRPSGLYQGDAWTGTALHLAAMAASVPIVAMLLEAGANVNARSDSGVGRERQYARGAGPTALHIVLDTGTFYGRRGEALDRDRLDIARLLVRWGAVVEGVADRFGLEDVLNFELHQELWDALRAGISKDERYGF